MEDSFFILNISCFTVNITTVTLISRTGGCLQSRCILAIQIMHNNTRGHHSPNDASAVGLYSLHSPSSPYPDLNVGFKKHLL